MINIEHFWSHVMNIAHFSSHTTRKKLPHFTSYLLRQHHQLSLMHLAWLDTRLTPRAVLQSQLHHSYHYFTLLRALTNTYKVMLLYKAHVTRITQVLSTRGNYQLHHNFHPQLVYPLQFKISRHRNSIVDVLLQVAYILFAIGLFLQ